MSPALSPFPTDLSCRPTADASIETMFDTHDLSSGLMYAFEAPLLSNLAVTVDCTVPFFDCTASVEGILDYLDHRLVYRGYLFHHVLFYHVLDQN